MTLRESHGTWNYVVAVGWLVFVLVGTFFVQHAIIFWSSLPIIRVGTIPL